MTERYSIRIAVYVIFEKDGKVLLSLRKNTGYKDGMCGWVQGHVESGEGIKDAALREALEETGAVVAPEDMEMVAVVHNRIDLPYVDFVFRCRKWQGEIKNQEPESCGGLQWFAPDNLPKNIVAQVRDYVKLRNNDGVVFREINK